MADAVEFKVTGKEPEAERFRTCRQMLVGPWFNQPEEYEGYNGFVGWPGITRLRSGRWIVTFTSGYWHGSPPQTEEVLQDEWFREFFEGRYKIGCPRIHAPRGGRAHIMSSDDEGLTWSKPATLVDTDMDERHPTVLELNDGTLFCSFFANRAPKHVPGNTLAKYILSRDGGRTWTAPTSVHPGARAFGNGSAILLSDGTVVWAIQGRYDEKHGFESTGIFHSSDNAKTFELAGVASADRDLTEPTIAELPDGRLVSVSRRPGYICWSEDRGRTWTHPADMGVDIMIAGHTHGGQCRFPGRRAFTNSCDLPLRLTAGIMRHRNTLAVVTRGLGESRLPLRLFCPPQLPIYTLRRGPMRGRATDHIDCIERW